MEMQGSDWDILQKNWMVIAQTQFFILKKKTCVKTNAFIKVRHKCAQQDGKYGIKIFFVGK